MWFGTGIYIRAKINDKWRSIDITDPRLSNIQLLDWLATLDSDSVQKTLKHFKEVQSTLGSNDTTVKDAQNDPKANG